MGNTSDKLQKIRSEYGDKALEEDALNSDPVKQFELWLGEAMEADAEEPNAMVLSTVDSENNPRSRYVLFKNIVNNSLVFHTHYESDKAKEIPRPEFWGGYLIDLNYWEFWQGRKNRTHDRFSYSKVDKGWKIKRLSP